MEIRLATIDDIPALRALEERYYSGNLDPSERAEGYISKPISVGRFVEAVEALI